MICKFVCEFLCEDTFQNQLNTSNSTETVQRPKFQNSVLNILVEGKLYN